jgi:uncharacterized alpha-E superfamily protein
MLSRVADNLYWMARYLERAQHTARLLDVTLDLVPDRSAAAVTRSWERLFASLHLAAPEELPLKGRPITELLALDADGDISIVHHVAAARENARQVRELISTEMWEQINRLYLDLQHARMDRVWAAPHGFFQAVKQGAHLFQGITDTTMTRGEGWHFIQLGQYLERAGNVAALLSAHLDYQTAGAALPHPSDLYLEWLGLLRSCTAFEAYCKVYSADLRFEEIAEFLLLNDSFPFSINFAASMLRTAVESIADTTDTRRNNPILRRIGRLKATLDYEQIDELMAADLGSTLQTIQSQCAHLHADIFQAYIAYPVEAKLTY